MRELKIPTILRSHRKWSFLHHGAWRCLNYTERAASHVDIHCLNEPIVLSTRHLILKESQRSDNALIGLQEGSLSLQFFSNRGTCKIR